MAMMNEMEYRTIGSALAGGYRVTVYCRLSKDDDLQGESASIANHLDMLEKYCENQGWNDYSYFGSGKCRCHYFILEAVSCCYEHFEEYKKIEDNER